MEKLTVLFRYRGTMRQVSVVAFDGLTYMTEREQLFSPTEFELSEFKALIPFKIQFGDRLWEPLEKVCREFDDELRQKKVHEGQLKQFILDRIDFLEVGNVLLLDAEDAEG